jgi:hypothetical protein
MPENPVGVTASNGSILLFENASCRKLCIHSQATVWFSKCLQFPVSIPWKACFKISWCPGINLSVATCLPIRFLETAYMSQYIHIVTCRRVHATKMTGSRWDDGIYLQLVYTFTPNYTYIQQYSVIAHLHTLQFTVAHAPEFFLSPLVFS